MKNSKIFKFSILGLLPLVMSVGVISFGLDENKVHEVNAYSNYTEGTLPTYIDLNDASESTIRKYYSGLNGKAASELSGTNLLKNLKPILSNGQKYFAYDSTSPKNAIWRAYEIVDRDWTLSPASKIPGYNASTNTITGYQYKASTSFSSDSNPYLHSLYVNRSMTNPMKAWGNHNQTAGGINQEHIFPKSHGFDTEGAGGARGDLMHLWSADGYSNKVHSNYSYGNVDKTKSYECTVDTIEYATDNYLGTSKTLGTGIVFEPQDSDKGDIARALFYMAARYNNYAGETTGIDSNDPYLVLRDITSPAMQKGSTCTATQPGEYGILTDLLEWNKLDPVDDFEIHRNNILFNTYTKNRNPFIDFPEWADIIWGGKQGTANPTTDKINGDQTTGGGGESGGGEEDNPPATELNYSKTSSIAVGDRVNIVCERAGVVLSTIKQYSASVGEGTAYTNLTNSTSFEVVKGVTNGTYAFKKGNNYLAWTEGNSLSYASTIDQSSSWLVSFSDGNVTLKPYASTDNRALWYYTTYSRFACYKDKTAGETYYALQLYKGSEESSTVGVTGVSLNQSEVSLVSGTSIKLTATILPSDATNKNVTWSSNNTGVATVNNGSIRGVSAGTAIITVKTVDGNYTATCTVIVTNPVVLTEIVLSGTYKTSFLKGTSFDTEGLVVTAKYSDNSTEDVTEDVDIEGYDMNQVGNQTITVTYQDKTATYSITINDVTVSSIAVDTTEAQLVFEKGDLFSSEGVVVTATYADQSKIVVENATFTGFNSELVGSQTITVTFGGKTATYAITVVEKFNGNLTSIDFSQMGYENQQAITQEIKDGVKYVFDKGTNSNKPKYFTSGTAIRMYGGNSLLISASRVISTVKITFGSSDGSNELICNGGVLNTTTNAYEINGKSVSFLVGGTTGNRRIKKVEVNFYVPEVVLTGITLTPPTDVSYYQNEVLNTSGMKVVASYSDGSSKEIALANCSISSVDLSTVGTKTVTVTYTEKGVSVSQSFQITVLESVLVSIEATYTKNSTFNYGATFDKTGIKVVGTYSSGVKKELSADEYDVSVNMNHVGTTPVTITTKDGSLTASFNITIVNYVKKIEISGTYKTEYNVGDTVNHDGVVVTLVYADGSKTVATSGYTFTDPSMSKPGEKNVKVTYGDVSANYKITIADYVTQLRLDGEVYMDFNVGDEFDCEGLLAHATYASGAKEDLTLEDLEVIAPDMNKGGYATVVVKYKGAQATYNIYIADPNMGCFGSVVTSSLIISFAAILGAGLLILKKKEN